jgi:hypothetical protein
MQIVNILVHDDTITVSPTIIRVTAGEVVRWQAPGADSFVLVFRDGAAVADRKAKTGGPYGRGVEVTSARGGLKLEKWISALLAPAKITDEGPVAQATITGGVGVHQYQLAVRKGDKLYLDVGCPEVIIQ